jgi:signal peptidase I
MKPTEIEVTRVWREVPVPPPEDRGEDPWGRPVTKTSAFKIKSLLAITVIVVFIVTFVVQACRVPSESMQNTLLSGDFLLADKLHFADDEGAWDSILPYRAIQRGDIIVFRYPLDPSTYFVKRVVGVPGDHIHLKNKIVYVNGNPLKESYALHAVSDNDPYRDNFPAGNENAHAACPVCNDLPRFISRGDVVVPAGRYFVMGDNRDHSSDSRYWGFVPRRNIVGRPLLIYLSVCGGADSGRANCGDKLYSSGQILAPLLRLARWDRMFRLIR